MESLFFPLLPLKYVTCHFKIDDDDDVNDSLFPTVLSLFHITTHSHTRSDLNYLCTIYPQCQWDVFSFSIENIVFTLNSFLLIMFTFDSYLPAHKH